MYEGTTIKDNLPKKCRTGTSFGGWAGVCICPSLAFKKVLGLALFGLIFFKTGRLRPQRPVILPGTDKNGQRAGIGL